jgi:hypothetical protein
LAALVLVALAQHACAASGRRRPRSRRSATAGGYAGGGAGEAAAAEEHVGTWLNWLFKVKVFGRPVTDSAQPPSFSLLLIVVLIIASVIGGRRFSVRRGIPGAARDRAGRR